MMSTYYTEKVKCGLCGYEFEKRTIGSTHAIGRPDLDLRPSAMLRYDLLMHVVRCPNCGYVHADIEKNAEQHEELIKTNGYEKCWDIPFKSDLTCNFCRYALVLRREGDKKGAFYALLCGAWTCDDCYDYDGADFCRSMAIGSYNHEEFGGDSDYALMYIDLLRRTGRFEEAIEFCKTVKLDSTLKQQIADFQVQLSKNEDTECYTVAVCDAVFIHLNDEAFDLIKSGKKKTQVQCNNEKYRSLKVGDKIIFCRNSNPKENLFAEITELKSFETFEELQSFYSAELFGCDELTGDLSFFADNDYIKEVQERIGFLEIGIKIRHPSFYD